MVIDSLPSVFVIPGNDFLNPKGVKRRVIRQLDAQDRICSGDIAALTQTQTDFTSNEPMLQMILCPVIFDTSLFLESISDLPAKSTDYISKFRSRGSAFLHESCHILGQQCEFPSFDLVDLRTNAVNFPRPTSDAHIVNDKMYYENGAENKGPQSPYGPQNILALATAPEKFSPQYGVIDTKFLPDAYRIYGEMSLYPGTNWLFTSPKS
jgi:hypothetical protein